MARQDLVIDREMLLRDRTEPDFVIALSMADETTARIFKQLL
jgi:hypothetical protein